VESLRTVKVAGDLKTHKVLLYTLSTCVWCKRLKAFLKEHGVEYEFIDVDHCSRDERKEISDDMLSYPTIIIDDEVLITGFHEDKLLEVLRI
jgi:glutaredoxin-like protein NrdH